MSSNRNQGIRLPPISFLSNQYLQNLQQHQQQQLPLQLLTSPQISTTKLTPASNIGIQMYLNNPSSQSPNIASLSPPQSNEDNVNKNLETLASPPQILSSVSQNRPPPSQQQSPVYSHFTLPHINQPQQQQHSPPQQQQQAQSPPQQQSAPTPTASTYPHSIIQQQSYSPPQSSVENRLDQESIESKRTQKSEQQQKVQQPQQAAEQEPPVQEQPKQGQQQASHFHHHHHSPHHHHHHHHHYHHRLDNSSESTPLANTTNGSTKRKNDETEPLKPHRQLFKRRPTPKLNLEPINQIIKELFPQRHFLGTLIYNPTTTWETLQTAELYGLKPELQNRFNEIKQEFIVRKKYQPFGGIRYIPTLPPLPSEYINTIIEVKIPFRHIILFKQDIANELITRELWGGASGIYTDDSDILQVLMHLGLFNNTIDLSIWNKKWTTKDLIKPLQSQLDNNDDGTNFGIDKDVYGDLSVEILLLPNLPKYYGFYQNGINSRSWLISYHSGLSFAVYNVKWETRKT